MKLNLFLEEYEKEINEMFKNSEISATARVRINKAFLEYFGNFDIKIDQLDLLSIYSEVISGSYEVMKTNIRYLSKESLINKIDYKVKSYSDDDTNYLDEINSKMRKHY